MLSIKSFKSWASFVTLISLVLGKPGQREITASITYTLTNTHSGHPFKGHVFFYKETILCFHKIICSKCAEYEYSRTQQDVCFAEYQHVDPRHNVYLLCSKKHISELL